MEMPTAYFDPTAVMGKSRPVLPGQPCFKIN